MRVEVPTEQAMLAFGAACARTLDSRSVIALDGELGAGKTVFVRGMAEGLGIDPALVSSPTFVILQRYRGSRFDLLHADAYRVRSATELESIGWSDAVSEPAVVAVIEWAARVPEAIPTNALRIEIEHGCEGAPEGRTLTVVDPDAVRSARMQVEFDRVSRALASITGSASVGPAQPMSCAVCGKALPEHAPHAPFCSPRCRSADLGRWLSERYRVSRPLGADDLDER